MTRAGRHKWSGLLWLLFVFWLFVRVVLFFYLFVTLQGHHNNNKLQVQLTSTKASKTTMTN